MVPPNFGGNLLQIGIHKVSQFLGRHILREASELTDVGKHHRHLFADAVAQVDVRDALFTKELEVFRGKKPGKGIFLGLNLVEGLLQLGAHLVH